MTEAQRIIDMLRKSIEGEAWHGSAVFELLEGVSAEQAAARPFENAHTIWEITDHIAVWAEVTLSRFRGHGPEQVPPDQDWPSMTDLPDETEWRAIKERVRRAHEAWYAELESMDDTTLHRPRLEKYPSAAFVLYGVMQHNAYHGGQIALLKKAL